MAPPSQPVPDHLQRPGAPNFPPAPSAPRAPVADSPWSNTPPARVQEAHYPPARPQPPAALQHRADAAERGLVAASDAAADPSARASAAGGVAPHGDSLQVLWMHDEIARVLRERAEWRELLERAEAEETRTLLRTGHLARNARSGIEDEPSDQEDRRDLVHVLSNMPSATETDVDKAFARSLQTSAFAPDVVLLAGTTRLEFDPLARLQASIVVASSRVPPDEPLKLAIQSGRDVVSSPGGYVPTDIALAAVTRIADAFGAGVRAGWFEEQVELALLEKRAFSARAVFGGRFLRGAFTLHGSERAFPLYFPEAVAKRLPLFRTLPTRVIAEIHAPADEREVERIALRAVAVARLLHGTPRR